MLPNDFGRLVVPKSIQEAVGKPQGPTYSEWQEALIKSKLNPFFRYLVREGIYKDYSQALGAVHDKVVEAAVPELIGRELLTVIPVTKDPVRFVKAIKGKAWKAGEAETPITPEMYEHGTDITAEEYKSRAEWSQTFLEDAEWGVTERFVKECGRSIGEEETTDVIAMYNAITAGNLAGGAEQTITDGAVTWAQFVNIISVVRQGNFHPTVVALSEKNFTSLMEIDQFVNALYYAPEKAIRTGVVETTLGVKVVASSLITKTLCIDANYVALTVRRELTSKPYENPAEAIYGVLATERVGMQVFRETAVARGDH